CNYTCNFCQRTEDGIRFRPVEAVIDEIKKYIRDYGITYIIFWDELFMVSKKRVYEIAEAILKENININYWCTGRLNVVDEDLIKIMKRSGCAYISYGIEQFDNNALKAMNKKLTEDQIVKGIEITQKENIYIGFNIIFGNIGDTRQSLKKSLKLLEKYNDYSLLRVIRPVTPYPGSPLYYVAIEKGLITGPEDFYKLHNNVELLTVNFTDIPDDEFYQLMYDANRKIIEDYYKHQISEMTESFENIYFKKDYDFRGARH
ncbi:MAG: radical SAM protein, partial [SAR202 cluster bacterium]|nr:radical SAM protein [SAR202 cluster bacterium]